MWWMRFARQGGINAAMQHVPPAVTTLVVALVLALALGMLARALRLPALFGYLVAGVVVSPHTPGFVADSAITGALAEIGVALLLFGVGLHFQPRDLLAVWRVAVPGALAQVAIATALGAAAGTFVLGLDAPPAMVFGLTLAIASTAVATRLLEERGMLGGPAGKIALGWLVMQDLIVVLALVLVPAAAGADQAGLAFAIGRAVLELIAFVALVFVVGRRVLPWALARVARNASRELFTLAVVVAAIGVAWGASTAFHVSFALGAFFAGVVLGESDLGSQAAAEAIGLQRVFSALFFVSVGMMMDPVSLLAAPWGAVAALAAVLLGTGGATFLLLLLLRVQARIAATVAAALAQIGEFSFLLMGFAVGQGILPATATGPILGAAFGAILLTPLSERLSHAVAGRLGRMPGWRAWEDGNAGGPVLPTPDAGLEGHAIVVGHGRVGGLVVAALRRHGLPFVVVEADRNIAERLAREGIPAIWGDSTRPEVLAAARPAQAKLLVLALPDAEETRRVLDIIRAANPKIQAAARAHDDSETSYLAAAGVGLVIMGEREIALGMADFAMQRLGIHARQAQATVDSLRAALEDEDENPTAARA